MVSLKQSLKSFLQKLDNKSRSIYFLSQGCCSIEIDNLCSSNYDLQRLGYTIDVDDPREATVLIVSGWINDEFATKIKDIYSQIAGDKAVIAVGACSISQTPYINENGVKLTDILPVDIFVPGCPPRPEAIIEAIRLLEKTKENKETSKIIYGAIRELG